MDLNYLLRRHQVSLMRAAGAGCAPSRASHHALASGYAENIRAMQQRSGALARPLNAGLARIVGA